MPDTPTPGQVAYAAYGATSPQWWTNRAHVPWGALPPSEQAAWEAAAEAVLACPVPQARSLLYVVVMEEDGQIQLCGAYPSTDEAMIHLAHARTIMPDRQLSIRVCPFALTGQAHRQEDTPHA